jgi:hypothetical protein
VGYPQDGEPRHPEILRTVVPRIALMDPTDEQLHELWDVALFRATTRGTDPVLEYARLILEQCPPTNARPTSPSS